MSTKPIAIGPRSHSEPVPQMKASPGTAAGVRAQPPDSIDARLPANDLAELRRQSLDRHALVRDLLAQVPPADRFTARTAIPAIIDAARTMGAADPNRIGYFLATAQIESDFGANMVEGGHSKEWFNRTYGHDDGNRPGSDDGFLFRGRGYVQTTHAGRYAEMSHQLGLPDVVALDHGKPVLDAHGKPKMQPALNRDPDKLVEPKLAARALVLGVMRNLYTRDASAAIDKTIPSGRPPGDADFVHARAIVNGIVLRDARTISDHATRYARILDDHPLALRREAVIRTTADVR